MQIAVLVKQVPRFEDMALGPDGRLVRAGLQLEMNPYCRRAVSKGVELAAETAGTCTVFTLGPPDAAEVLREAVAWGADRGVLVSDPAFAGSDTLATARALARALEKRGPFDLVLAGKSSVDADTGQVGPEVAELAGLPFLTGARELALDTGRLSVRCEQDDGWVEVEVDLPAVLSCAERLCPPAKVPVEERGGVPPQSIETVSATDLGEGPWGQAGSPTRVGDVRVLENPRDGIVLEGTAAEQVEQAVRALGDSGALGHAGADGVGEAPERVPDGWERGRQLVAVLTEHGRRQANRELLGAAARLASGIGGQVVAFGTTGAYDRGDVGSFGADAAVEVTGVAVEQDVARALRDWCEEARPWAVLAPGTVFGREVAARVAAGLGAGLTGDAVELTAEGARLVAWKPAFGGKLVAAITASSPVQLATVRPGVLPLLEPRTARRPPVAERPAEPASRVRTLGATRDDDVEVLARSQAVVGVGTGVDPSEYSTLGPLLAVLGAEMGATRKVTDKGWQPRSRQIGLTGRSISPRLYVAVALSGKFNHMIGVRGAGKILAINSDARAPVFGGADVGIVGDWRGIVPLLARALGRAAKLART